MRSALTVFTFFLLHFALFIGEAMAQTPPPGGGSVGAPLDGVSAMLLAAGVGYGARMIGKKRRERD